MSDIFSFDPPGRLATIANAPKQLYGRGSLEALDEHSVAIVGARACTAYGRETARQLAKALSQGEFTIVSGLARGIDAEAHRGTVSNFSGPGDRSPTIAVLGCGIDQVYPAVHTELANLILEAGGLIVSEYEPGTPPAPWRFPARNRIIAGLCDAMIVVEARERSGALIAADFALEQGRPLFAVPGRINDETAKGPNDLIANGYATALVDTTGNAVFARILDPAGSLLDPEQSAIADSSA